MADTSAMPATVVAANGFLAVNIDGAVRENPVWFDGYTPVEGDSVRVIVARGEVIVLGKVSGEAVAESVYVDPETPTGPTPPAASESGVLKIVPTDAGSRNAGGWNFNDVRQGTYGAYTYTGAYFYGSKPAQLDGATITSARIKLGARTSSGAYDSDLTLNLQRVTNKTKPSGSLTFTGSTDATNVGTHPGAAAWYPLDTAIAQALVDAGGGGIGVSGSPYGGVEGLDQDPYAGTLELTWTR